MKVGDKILFTKMFKMEGDYDPDLTVGKTYEVKDVLEDESFCILTDRNTEHYFDFFGIVDPENGFKTDDYFELVD